MRVLIADDQPDVRYAYHVLLRGRPGIEIVGEAKDAEEMLVKTLGTYPDVVLLDWELPGFNENSHLYHLRRALPGLFVIALSGRSEASSKALKAGADAFVSKVEPPENLLAAISNSSLFVPSATGRLLTSKV
jgi:DNA-binding NarL/FixJ family response regulator